MLELSRLWQASDSVHMPPCGGASDWSTLDAGSLDDLSYGRREAAEGQRKWLSGDCDGAMSSWVAASANQYGPSAIYLLYTERWREIVAPLKLPASHYAAIVASQFGEQNLVEEALAWNERAWTLSPNLRSALWLSDHYLSRGDTETARQLWSDTANAFPEDTVTHWIALGKAAAVQNEWLLAAQLFGAGAARASERNSLLLEQAKAYERAGESELAGATYAEVVNGAQFQPEAYAAIVYLAEKQQKLDEALEWQQRASQLARDDKDILKLGEAYLERGNVAAARPHIEKLYHERPDDFWLTYLWSQVLNREGREQESIATLHNAIRLHPGRPAQWQVQLGDWLAASGDSVAARAAYATALEWGANSDEIEQKLDKIQ